MEKRKVGKPRKWKTREELICDINKYLNETTFEQYSITGLALALNTSKQLLCDYEKREGFDEIIKEAKLIVENSYELSLRKNGRTGDIFALKNFGWKDKSEVISKNVNANLEDEEALKAVDSFLDE